MEQRQEQIQKFRAVGDPLKAEGDLNELYREVILDHFKNPRHRTILENPHVHAEGENPLCGDEVTVELKFEGEKVKDISVRSRGCSISQASGSIMGQELTGKTEEEIYSLISYFKGVMRGENIPDNEEDWGDLETLSGVCKFPVRVKCALLPWTTLEEGLKEYKKKQF